MNCVKASQNVHLIGSQPGILSAYRAPCIKAHKMSAHSLVARVLNFLGLVLIGCECFQKLRSDSKFNYIKLLIAGCCWVIWFRKINISGEFCDSKRV